MNEGFYITKVKIYDDAGGSTRVSTAYRVLAFTEKGELYLFVTNTDKPSWKNLDSARAWKRIEGKMEEASDSTKTILFRKGQTDKYIKFEFQDLDSRLEGMMSENFDDESVLPIVFQYIGKP